METNNIETKLLIRNFWENAAYLNVKDVIEKDRRDIHARNCEGVTTLHMAAAYSRDIEAVQLLLNEGAKEYIESVTGERRTPLHYAAAYSSMPDVINLLIGEGANKEAKDKGGKTPLHLAAHMNSISEIAVALINRGADDTARDELGKTPFDYIKDNKNLKDTEAYRLLEKTC